MNDPGKALFRYPLCLESLSVLLFVSLFAYALIIASLISYVISQGAPLYLIGIVALLGLINIFFEYGHETIEFSSRGYARPPALAADTLNRGRFGRQLLMTGFFTGVITGLFVYQLDYAALFMLTFVIVVFPASLTLNTLYEDFAEVINPVSLIGFISIVGRSYVAAVMALAMLLVLFYASWTIHIIAFLLWLPFGLYGALVLFRYLGLLAHEHMDQLVQEPNYEERNQQIEQYYDDNANLHQQLENAYWELKNKRVDAAIKLVAPLIQLGDWARFDAVFEIVSQWPNSKPAIHFIRLYLPVSLQQGNEMKALKLCQWCLQQDSAFALEDGELMQRLVSASASVEQYVVAVKLLDNFVDANPGYGSARRLLTQAADICQAKLHHQQKFDELTVKIQQLDDSNSGN